MSTPKVLLVDDVNMFLELEKSFLKLSPVRVYTARDGAEALEVIKSERPDLIFMDLNMPNMNGAQCCAVLKGDPDLKSIPVVIITTAGKQEDKDLCTQAGCNAFLTKPVERKSFLEMARKYLMIIERREARVSCKIPVMIKFRGETITGEGFDISERGIYIGIDNDIGKGSAVEVKFTLPDDAGIEIEN